jgi:hypothetical protein
MSTLPAAILETILTHLTTLFLQGAGGDPEAARLAASQMLDAYHPETTDELRLAANIISFSFQALEALAQAATPDISLTRILRLRGSAVSLSREAAKAERRLTQLQKTRQQAIPTPQPEIQPQPKVETAHQETAEIITPGKPAALTWTQAHEDRQREIRIAASLERAQARIAAQANAAIQARPDHHSRTTA